MALIYVVEDDDNIREIETIALKNSNYLVKAFARATDLIGGEALASDQSLYLTRGTPEAAPKCISGSTSYLRV